MHVNLGGVDAIESAVELGVGEAGVDAGVHGGFFVDDFGGRSERRFGLGVSSGNVARKLWHGARNSAGK